MNVHKFDLVYTIYCTTTCTTHPISDVEVKSILVHEIPHHWEATTYNCIVKVCPTTFHLKCLLSKERQQVLGTLKGSTTGSKVKGSG